MILLCNLLDGEIRAKFISRTLEIFYILYFFIQLLLFLHFLHLYNYFYLRIIIKKLISRISSFLFNILQSHFPQLVHFSQLISSSTLPNNRTYCGKFLRRTHRGILRDSYSFKVGIPTLISKGSHGSVNENAPVHTTILQQLSDNYLLFSHYSGISNRTFQLKTLLFFFTERFSSF